MFKKQDEKSARYVQRKPEEEVIENSHIVSQSPLRIIGLREFLLNDELFSRSS